MSISYYLFLILWNSLQTCIFQNLTLKTLFLFGDGNVFIPSLDNFPVLNGIQSENATSYPLTKFPPKLNYLRNVNSFLNTITNIPVSPFLSELRIDSNNIMNQGIDYNNILKDSVGNLKLVVYSVPTAVTIPANFICDYAIDQTGLILVFGSTIMTGRNLGWTVASSNNTVVTTLVPNRKMQVTVNQVITGAPQPFSITLNAALGYVLDTTVAEAGFNVTNIKIQQYNGARALLVVTFSNLNDYFSPTAHLDNFTPDTQMINTADKTIIYPLITNLSSEDEYLGTGSIVKVSGQFGVGYTTLTVVFQEGDLPYTNCVPIVNNLTSTEFYCVLDSVPGTLDGATTTVNVTEDGFWQTFTTQIKTLQTQCNEQTNFCHGHGECNRSSVCICNINQGSYYNNCSKPYPFATSGQVNDQNTTID
ncbi:hypothetical protein DFA_05160 [Cavenderia fasciculata]|uniref:EGF-like domain-containing protein n=1 Tax=Cavenderia fasciculata TaxID=261658 RepID=F4PNH7_CACFS|nr:uncharacterized protein DFA_05160 [Cavenderia fasciculata]EGG23030.1 hypothetical protein DFA_05160 [Cavenderia fasciculata]|eukprot:XP_004360881.1 hypothetical protein DFA_05160 [Cavenderia fasciculata]